MKNETFFDNIDSEIKAYLLGFYVADGSISMPNENRVRYEFRVGVSEKDAYIINLFREHMFPDGNLFYVKESPMTHFDPKYIQKAKIGICINSKYLCTRLDNLGYGARKSKKEMYLPDIDPILIRHFIRGYFDGDGVCIVGEYNRKDRPNKRVKPTFAITNGDDKLLISIQQFLQKGLDIDLKIYKETNKHAYNLKTSCYPYLRKLYPYLYDDSNFYLQRKKESFSKVMLTPREFRELKNSEPRNA